MFHITQRIVYGMNTLLLLQGHKTLNCYRKKYGKELWVLLPDSEMKFVTASVGNKEHSEMQLFKV